MKTASQYRAQAREVLGGNVFSNKWLMAVVVVLVYTAILGAASTITWGIAAILLSGFLLYGFDRVFLRLVRGGEEVELAALFDGKDNAGQTILLGLLSNIFVFLWSLLFIIPGIIKLYSYSMAFYILNDNPGYDWKMCLDESKRMMRGNKWRLFCLHLSYIGWLIVGALCFGIGTLWVKAYMEAATAAFYDDLKNGDITVKVEE